MGKRLIITEEEKKHIILLYEQSSPMTITGRIYSSEERVTDVGGEGFYDIKYSRTGIVTSVENTYVENSSKQTTQSQNKGMSAEYNSSISFNYHFDNSTKNLKNIVLNVKSNNGQTASSSFGIPTSKDSKYMGNFSITSIPTDSQVTVSVQGDENNSLLVKTAQLVNCDEEWKEIYDDLEMSNNEGIDKGLYYCKWADGQKSTDYIKGKMPDIDVRKIQCLKDKIKSQYC